MTRFIRVKNRTTRHEFDIPKQQFDPEKHSRVSRYPETWAPRPPKPFIPLGGDRRPHKPVNTDKE